MTAVIQNELAQAQWLRAVGYAPYGGADTGECLAVAAQVAATDPTRWYDAWNGVAGRLLEAGERSLAANDPTGARSAYFRASNYFRTAGIFMLAAPIDPRLRSAHHSEVDAFRRGAALLEVPPELIDVSVGQDVLTCYFFRPSRDGAPRPTIVLTNGYDGSAEELYFTNGAAALERGYNVLAFDGPGQGSALIEKGIAMRPDWEEVITPIIDVLEARDDVDSDRIALMGLSFGGYLAPRAAAVEHRIAACVSDCGPYDLFDAAISRVPGFLASAIDDERGPRLVLLRRLISTVLRRSSAGWALRRNLLVHGIDDPIEYFRAARDYTLKGRERDITCPTFVCTTDRDDLSASGARALYGALRCPKEFLQFDSADGAGEHCESGARLQFHRSAFAWLNAVMSGSTAAE